MSGVESFPQGLGNTSLTFSIKCRTDYPTMSSILEVVVYSFADCINACGSYNYNLPLHNDSVCVAVTYEAQANRAHGGNCLFKHDEGLETVANIGIDTAFFLSG